jgi:lipid-A-disaccharide synthase
MKKCVILAGEKSGDLIGAEVCERLLHYGFDIFGIGGENMLKNGLKKSFFDIKEISIMGFLEVLPKVFAIKKRIRETASKILEINPSFVLTIDAPGFNARVVSLIKPHFKGKIFHAVAPTVWAYKEKRAKKFAKLYNALFCILPFEPQYFTKEGLVAEYICYPPLFRVLGELEDVKNKDKEYILFSLGSRKTEVLHHLKFAKEVVLKIKAVLPKIIFVFPSFEEFEEDIKQIFPDEIVCIDSKKKLEYAKRAKFAISKSGTGAVETSFLGVPSIIFYKVNMLSYIIIKMMAKVKFVNLINILLKKESIPEFIQGDATPTKVANKAIEMMQNVNLCQAQLEDVNKAKEIFLQTSYTNFGEGVVDKIIKIL